jgi:hypothetical protein
VGSGLWLERQGIQWSEKSGHGLLVDHETIVRQTVEMIGKLGGSFCGMFSVGCEVWTAARS